MIERSPAKGATFEIGLEEALKDVAAHLGDYVTRIGTTSGSLSQVKTGDLVIRLAQKKGTIVVEAKNRFVGSVFDILAEAERARSNRDADYVLYLTNRPDQLPRDSGGFQEYEGTCLVAAVGRPDEDRIDPVLLRVAYRWARLRVASLGTKGDALDTSEVKKDLREIQAALASLSRLSSQFRAARDAIGTVESEVEKARRTMQETLDRILARIEGPRGFLTG